jgi:hypothetical protein
MMSVPIRSGPGIDPDELRGWACRKNLAEDARWAMDTILSSGQAPEFMGPAGLILSHHFVRIAYEGAIAIRSPSPHVGVPALAALLQDSFADLTARARHLTKLLDNTQKTYAGVLSELAAELATHREALTGRVARPVRWLQTDLGLCYAKDAMVGATIPLAYRLGLHPTRPLSIWGADLESLTKEWGGTLAILGAAAYDSTEPTAALDLTRIAIVYEDRRADKYLKDRFDPEFPPELKILILLIEGDLNTSRVILPLTAHRHQNAVFRARAVTLYHSLSALERISDHYRSADSPGLRGLRAILADAAAQRLLSPSGEKVRNRSVHYEMNDPAILPDLTRPMNGIVEAICPRRSWEEFESDINLVTERTTEHLANWKP